MTGALLAATVVVPGSVAALADRVSGPVAAAAAVVVGVLLLLNPGGVAGPEGGAQDHRDRGQRRSGGRDACRDANLDPSSDQHCHAVRRIGICEEDHGGSWMIHRYALVPPPDPALG